MPKTTTWKPKRIRSEDERGSGSSDYISLDEGEKFLGYALFEGDPSVDDPGYYEYAEHWDTSQGKGRSVPCAGDDCPLCEDGDRPRTRAKTLWLVTQDQKKTTFDPPQLRIFNFNYNVIKAVTEMRAEGEKVKGQMFRVSRLDDRGNYTMVPKTGQTLKATEIKEALKDPKAPDFDAMVTGQLRKAMEGLAVKKAVEDDDDEPEADEDEKPAAKKAAGKAPAGKSSSKAKDWPDEIEDEVVTVVEVEDAGNYFTAKANGFKGTKNVYTTDKIKFDLSDLEEDQEVTVTAAQDDEGDFVLSAEPEVAEPEEEEEAADDGDAPDNDLPDSIEDTEMEVTNINAGESTIDVKSDDYEFTLYFLDQGPASEVDFDDYEEGMTIVVSAEKDSQGDMVATEVPKAKKKTGAKKTTTGRKTAAGKGK